MATITALVWCLVVAKTLAEPFEFLNNGQGINGIKSDSNHPPIVYEVEDDIQEIPIDDVRYPQITNDLGVGMLYPRESETRQQKSLDGIWNFVMTKDKNSGYRNFYYQRSLKEVDGVMEMPVPSSYNDVTLDKEMRDHVGPVWYDRTFYVPISWCNDTRVWLRFGSVHYSAQVWINNKLAMGHEIGHLPFEAEITSLLNFGAENLITVACDNTLTDDTVPQGWVYEKDGDEGKFLMQDYSFDFFNYAGIHRPVVLHTTPLVYIDDITTSTVDISSNTATVEFDVSIKGVDDDQPDPYCRVALLDNSNTNVAQVVYDVNSTCSGKLTVKDPKLWWPYLMSDTPGEMYTVQVTLTDTDEKFATVLDVYRQPIGIRMLRWTNTTFLINERPVYLRGFGRHEDSDIRGKGLDLPLVTRDYNLIKWIGANAYRTSHYPYAEEIMDFADKQGIMIIDECPSVDTEKYSSALLKKHIRSLSELVRRDKNRPGVIAWSLANEPRTQLADADSYFGQVADHVRSLDRTRPLTIAIARSYSEDLSAKHLDIISFNRYNGWYSNPGRTQLITNQVINEATAWFRKHNKPIIMSEYGADTLSGLHLQPEYVWSEEYQLHVLSKHFAAFDSLRESGFFIGEFVWNFADFKTDQSTTRVGGNRKGIFTRDRQPKASAFHMRRRYWALAHVLDNAALPDDLNPYTISPNATTASCISDQKKRNEL